MLLYFPILVCVVTVCDNLMRLTHHKYSPTFPSCSGKISQLSKSHKLHV